jgi:hypothetical protein
MAKQPAETALTKMQNNLPDYLQGLQPSAVVKFVPEATDIFPRLSIKGKDFAVTMSGTRVEFDTSVRVIIIGVDQNIRKSYYPGTYSSDSKNPPSCFSLDGIAPSADSVAPYSLTCAGCPASKWHSAKKLGKQPPDSKSAAPACDGNMYFLMLIAEEGTDPDDIGIVQAQFKYSSYTEYLAYQEGIKALADGVLITPDLVYTRMSFKKGTEYPSVLFQADGWVPPKLVEHIRKLQSTDKVQKFLKPDPNHIGADTAVEWTPKEDKPVSPMGAMPDYGNAVAKTTVEATNPAEEFFAGLQDQADVSEATDLALGVLEAVDTIDDTDLSVVVAQS